MTFVVPFEGQFRQWPNYEEAEADATRLFAQNYPRVDAIGVFEMDNLMVPIWTISRPGYCGPLVSR